MSSPWPDCARWPCANSRRSDCRRTWKKRIRFERIVTLADWESKVDIYRGATFNLAHNFMQILHLRPQNRFEEFDRMYLVGGGTHPGSGLPVIFESARISSKLLLEDLN